MLCLCCVFSVVGLFTSQGCFCGDVFVPSIIITATESETTRACNVAGVASSLIDSPSSKRDHHSPCSIFEAHFLVCESEILFKIVHSPWCDLYPRRITLLSWGNLLLPVSFPRLSIARVNGETLFKPTGDPASIIIWRLG